MKTPNKPQKRGGKGKLRGEDGKAFSKDYQPSPEAKSAGWAKRKSLKDMLAMILSGKTPEASLVRRFVSQYTGIPESNLETLTLEQAMDMRQIEKAIKKGDTRAYEVIKDRVYGKAKQQLEHSGGDEPIKIFIDGNTINPLPDSK